MSDLSLETRRIVASRANFVCEYCLIAEQDSYFRFQVEHIISRKHGGSSELENLALACVFCNRFKGSDIASLKPGTSELVPLYNPRTNRWREHFQFNGVFIESLTDIGEATVRILRLNNDDQILEREVLGKRGRYPSEAALLLTTEH
ncbi:MAG TPA: HNH endonuclease signature motif containing protein [Pyrinomonadaceae bacterium]|nr:HNH endonuclease signature motif containing protein [Pyrinomonadaceae bacterium]